MSLPSEFINAIAKRYTPTGKDNSLLASQISPFGLIYDGGGVARPILQSDPITAGGDGVTEIVPALGDYQIAVLAAVSMNLAEGSLAFGSKLGVEAAVKKSITFNNAARGGEILPFNQGGWFITEPGAALVVTTVTAASEVQVTYIYLNGLYFRDSQGNIVIAEDGNPVETEAA